MLEFLDMKRIYLVRHGESEGNINGKFGQPFDGPLSDLGEKQASMIAERAKNIDFDVIIASPSKRAFQTAEKISEKTGKEIVPSKLFVERRRPSELVGLSWEDEKVVEYVRLREENKNDPDFRYSDEEVFVDLDKRAGEALDFLKERKEENILVATHGIFMKALLGKFVFEDKFTPLIWTAILEKFQVGNTAVTLLEENEKGKWTIKTWNDQAHLGEISQI